MSRVPAPNARIGWKSPLIGMVLCAGGAAGAFDTKEVVIDIKVAK